ncbi:substrate-binding domain-containing protein [Scytonema sp. UIC 10036]|uniref:substrate-binding domain-containing protein n=1 Tax=Scytonema sp. UIC 10036 TaxID=2304196 RepID=UPI00140F618F|nr:substrate-binding domain-containing protein [Scytonema sp. UIC 10036]
MSEFSQAQSSPEASSSPPPETLSGLKVRIDGSDRMLPINQTLKQGFEKRVSGTEVEVAASGTEAALKALQDGNIDIAAIGRGLTPDEKAQGLELVRLRREKIAIVVGKDNPFKGSLTIKQFARIVRGRTTNWSRLGRTQGKIRFIDRPESSEIRQALQGYSVLKSKGFPTSSNTIKVTEEDTEELVKQLGKDGISYINAERALQLQGVRVVPIHGTLPKDSKYPFSLPLVYVYKKNPSSPASRFLTFAKTPEGKQAIENAKDSQPVTVDQSLAGMVIKSTSLSNLTSVTTNPTISPGSEATPTPPPTNSVIPMETAELVSPSHRAFAPPPENRNNSQETASVFWLMIPLSLGGLILWRSCKRRSRQDEDFQSGVILSPNSSQGQTSSQKVLYPPLPDVWDELAADEQEQLTQDATSSTPVEQQESEEVTTDVQPSTEVVNDAEVHISESTKTEPATTNNDFPADDKALDLDWEAPVAVVTPLYPKFSEIAAFVTNLSQEGTTEPDLCSELLDDSVISDQRSVEQ